MGIECQHLATRNAAKVEMEQQKLDIAILRW
jgi:hypothetical protein